MIFTAASSKILMTPNVWGLTQLSTDEWTAGVLLGQPLLSLLKTGSADHRITLDRVGSMHVHPCTLTASWWNSYRSSLNIGCGSIYQSTEVAWTVRYTSLLCHTASCKVHYWMWCIIPVSNFGRTLATSGEGDRSTTSTRFQLVLIQFYQSQKDKR